MVLVPIGSSVVDITVDGVTLVAGDEINDDTSYNLSTSYPARIKVDGNTKYTNSAHNQDTTYDVSTNVNPRVIEVTSNNGGYASKSHTVMDLRDGNWHSNDYQKVEARFKGYLDPSSGGFPTGYVEINGKTEASGSNTTVDTGWVEVNEPGRIRVRHNSNNSYSVQVSVDIAAYRITPKASVSTSVNES